MNTVLLAILDQGIDNIQFIWTEVERINTGQIQARKKMVQCISHTLAADKGDELRLTQRNLTLVGSATANFTIWSLDNCFHNPSLCFWLNSYQAHIVTTMFI